MRAVASGAMLLLGVTLFTGACATSEEWSEWRSHTTHFASGQHGVFSLRNNKDGSNPRVSRTHVADAQTRSALSRSSSRVDRDQPSAMRWLQNET